MNHEPHRVKLAGNGQTQTVGVLLSHPSKRIAAADAATTYEQIGLLPVEVDEVPIICRCSDCKDFVFQDEFAVKDSNGDVFCWSCYRRLVDVIEEEDAD